MISIIIPVYNVEKYLRRCVDSILNQTINEIEIILVDDGSIDQSGKICDEYAQKDMRVKAIHQENKGVSAARNKGLNMAQGEYIAFVDSDDFVDGDMYELLLANSKLYQADICACTARTLYENGQKVLGKDDGEISVFNKNEAAEKIVKSLDNALWNKLFTRQIVSDIGFEEGRTHGEDLYFILQCLVKCEKVVYINRCKYNYIKRENSITSGRLSKVSFDQVYFKDKSSELLNQFFPNCIKEGRHWAFASRLNLCRKILLSSNDQYKKYLEEYKKYLKQNFTLVNKELKHKEIVEYILIAYFPMIYKSIMKRLIRGEK